MKDYPKLYQFALEKAIEAVKCDNNEEFHKAMNLYQQAAEILIQFMKFNKTPMLQRICEEKVREFIDRAKAIKARLSSPRARKQSVTKTTSSGSANKAEDEGPMTEDEQKRFDTIEGTIVTESPNVSWNDIAGLTFCKQALREAIVLPILRPKLFTGARKPWSGILLFGPPGCGKSLMAKAAATECKATFFNVSSADILSPWIGESDKMVNALFEIARTKAPSLIFMDELDALTTKRGGQESSAERRVKTLLLAQIEGLKSTQDKPLLFLGATNRPWDIDTAMLSRFQKRIHVPLPDMEARKAIFKIHTVGIDTSLDDEDYVELAVRSEGYSGRDIANICREVIMLPVRELDYGGLLEDDDKEVEVRAINLGDFKQTLKKIKSMTTSSDLKMFEKWSDEYGEEF
jgi:vacuolar protein-sorting-associated protein 4